MAIEQIATIVMVVGFSILFVFGLLFIFSMRAKMNKAIRDLEKEIEELEGR